MRHLGSFVSTLALVTTLGACATSSDEGGLRAGDRGGKADGGECRSDEELIAAARAALIAAEPEFYGDVEWLDDLADVSLIDDLNGDGVEEAVVVVGLPYAGANTELVLYVSEQVEDADYACHTRFAGHFGGLGVLPAEDGNVTEGFRDIEVGNSSACDLEARRWVFDGSVYVETDDSRNENICDDE